MPITCPIPFPRLTQDEMRILDYEVMKCAFASQKALGRLGDETIYQAHLAQGDVDDPVSGSGNPALMETPPPTTNQEQRP